MIETALAPIVAALTTENESLLGTTLAQVVVLIGTTLTAVINILGTENANPDVAQFITLLQNALKG